jgi:hypothetical protein
VGWYWVDFAATDSIAPEAQSQWLGLPPFTITVAV